MPHPITLKARRLRSNMTEAEQCLWRHLRGSQLGVAFRRQYPIGPYISDFACVSLKLLIELDGGQHMEAQAYDQRRDAWLRGKGFRLLRFWNHDVLQNTEAVVEAIWREVEALRGG
ncbi:MAG: endonuclease domain-containing protein [Pseudomonadota bacterium]